MAARTLIGALLLTPVSADAWFTTNVPSDTAQEEGPGVVVTAAAQARHHWVLRSGQPLSEELKRAAALDGWVMRWELPHDYPIEADIPLSGSVEEMLRTLVRAYQARGEMAGVSPYSSAVNRVASIGVADMGVPK